MTFLGAVTASLVPIPKCWHNRRICSLILGHIYHLKPTTSSPCHRMTSGQWYIIWQNKTNTTATEHRDGGATALKRPALFYRSVKAMVGQPRRRRRVDTQAGRKQGKRCFPNTRNSLRRNTLIEAECFSCTGLLLAIRGEKSISKNHYKLVICGGFWGGFDSGFLLGDVWFFSPLTCAHYIGDFTYATHSYTHLI